MRCCTLGALPIEPKLYINSNQSFVAMTSEILDKNELQVEKSSSHGEGQVEHMKDDRELEILGYKPELQKNRSMLTLLFQSLAIAAIPYGEGAPLISAIYGGGQLSIFVGWIGK